MTSSAQSDVLAMNDGRGPRNARNHLLEVYEGVESGPTVIVTGALHGNEPAGVRAAEAVLARLRQDRIPLRGRLIAAVGNLAALKVNKRYVDRDLNRGWEEPRLSDLRRAPDDALRHEDREQRDLLDMFEPFLAEAREPIVFIDLHSTSGPGAPFVCMADVIRNRKVAFDLGIPVVLGLEEAIEGSMLGFFCDLGHIGVAIEGGQHDDPRTQARHEIAVWSALQSAGCLAPKDAPSVDMIIDNAVKAIPRVIEIRYRHLCRDGDGFRMDPGYANFQTVPTDHRVAQDYAGEIRTPFAGIMMLPRYQGLGEDGYFLARPVRSGWLQLSARLRAAGAHRMLPTLPGVRRHPSRPDHLIVDPKVARFAPTDVLHLFGFRRTSQEDDRLIFARRRPDGLPPDPLPSL